MIARIARSLSARLLLVFLLTSVVYGLASRSAVDLVLDTDYLREIIGAHMSLHSNYMLRDLGYPPSIERAEALANANPLDIRIDGPGIGWASDPNFPDPDELAFEPSQFVDPADISSADGRQMEREPTQLDFARYEGHSFTQIVEGDYRIIIVTPKLAEVTPPNLAWPIIGLISVLVLAACYFIVQWLVRPIGWIKAGADRIGGGDLDHRIPRVRNDELGELTDKINGMADDVQEMLEAKRQLLLAISHELRSPLTRTKVALEFLEKDATRESILEDVEEMEHLIHDLLEGERLNSRHAKLQLQETDVAALLTQVVTEDFADEHDRLSLDVPRGDALASVDPVRIRLLVRNLLSNALRHTSPQAPPIRISLQQSDEVLKIRVADRGAGMSSAAVAHATQPFYRADPARSRDSGGLGLGLYLCKRIAEAHGGELEIVSQEGEGTEVSVRLPRRAMLAA